ncbi:MAG TPA: IPT/TIG domain-containing protein [Thermoanaerobaculia bacterium]|nr:IPT/TIG domain-containing protein [Thermoanaerobaculia bacterium]
MRAKQHAVAFVEKAPAVFERNEGHFPKEYDFMSRADGQAFFVNASGARLIAGGGDKEVPAEIRLSFAGACADASPAGGEIASLTNYIYGNDRTKWRTGVASYKSVRYAQVYPGIDVEYHARRGMLEYDFVVAPGADFRAIALQFEGTTPLLDANGDLVLKAGTSEIRHRAPYVYQEIGGRQQPVESRYDLADGKVAFAVGDYDPALPLVIDPVIDFSRVIHPLTGLFPTRLEILPGGDLLIAGEAWGQAAAVVNLLPARKGSRDFVLTRMDPLGQNVRFTTYIGGIFNEGGAALAVDSAGNAYIAGTTASGDYPTTSGVVGEYTAPIETQLGGARAVVTKFDGSSGAVIYSTYIEDRRKGSTRQTEVYDIAVDSAGQAIISGITTSTKYPTTPGAFQEAVPPSNTPNQTYYVLTKLAADAKSYVFSTYGMSGTALLVDSSNNIYLGRANTVRKLDAAGNQIFLANAGGQIEDMAFDSNGNIVGVSIGGGGTLSPPAWQRTSRGEEDVYIWKLNSTGTTLLASTYYGGELEDYPFFVEVAPDDTIYVAGSTGSASLPVAQPFQSGPYDGPPYPPDPPKDMFIARFDPHLTQLLFGTYFGPSPYVGGFDLDASGNLYVASASGGLATWVKGPQPKWAVVEGDTIIARIAMTGTAPAFAINSLIPRAIEYGTGGNIDLRGHGFVPPVRVFFGEQETSQSRVTVWGGGTRIIAPLLDRNQPAVVDVKVINGTGQEITIPGGFEFLAPNATPSSSTPSPVPSLGGTITINGANIPKDAVVAFRTAGIFTYSLATNVMPSPPHSVTFTMAPVPRNGINVEFRVLHPRGDVFINRRLLVPIQGSPFPQITSVQPNVGPVTGGTQISISGTNFHPLSRVLIGDVYARTVTYLNSTGLSVVAPPNVAGLTSVTIVNPDHAAGQSLNAFTYRGVSTISPDKGPVAGGTAVTITGFGFSGASNVTFGGAAATSFNVVSDTQITAITPAHAAGLVDVTVNAGGNAYTLTNGFRFLEPPPTISSITPTFGPSTGNTAITINGSGFLPGIEVFLGGAKATGVNVVSATQLTAVTTPGVAGTVNVIVKNSDGQSATRTNGFTYRGIATITPPSALSGTGVTMSGAGFVAGATVTFGGTAATASVVNDTTITTTVPVHTPGLVDVVVTNPGGETFTYQNFRILPPAPTIASFSPTSGLPGTSVTITGTDFEFVQEVRFNNVVASFTVDSTTQITAIVPVTTAATAPITVTTSSGVGTSTTDFTIENAAAEITSFTPTMGVPGTTVVITGLKFGGASAVKFGSLPAASFTIDSSTQITATAPMDGITAPICIETPGPFSGCSATNFVFPPRIGSFSPANGAPGTVVTINGVSLHDPTAVTFNGAAATTFSANGAGTSITATVPNDATTGKIVVVTAAGESTSATNFGVPPVITSFTPLKTGVGNQVTITGLRFLGATGVSFNGTNASNFTVVNATTINAIVPVNSTTGRISVTTPGGVATSADPFEVAETPVILAFSPAKGTPGTVVTINGSDMDTATSVKFNGVSASFSIVHANEITATVPNTATTGPISVSNLEGSGVSATNFSLPATLSSFSPSSGSPGTVVTINGINFLGATAVTFNGTVATTFTVISNEQITATVPNGATTGVIKVATGYGVVQSSFNFTVLNGAWPSVIATATSSTSVALTWTGNASHTYQVRRIARKADSFGANVIATVTGNGFIDNAAAPNTTYLYSIYDVTLGQIGNYDVATTVVFTDDPLGAGTAVKTAHLNQLRTAVNAMRSATGLSPATFTDPSLAGVRIKTVHITQLRTALNEALVQLGRYADFTEPTLNSGAAIRLVHVRDLREAVK